MREGYAVRRKTGKQSASTGRRPAVRPPATETGGGRRSVRVIGGLWRGRRIEFKPVDGLRPTPDRVRETLFNWLQRDVVGRRCLDLFAGSGALGIEALSRGAASAVFVEHESRAARVLGEVLAHLQAPHAEVRCCTAEAYLASPPSPFDLVFLDPPFALGGLGGLCTLLETRGWLAPGALIYLEQSARDEPPALPDGWVVLRDTRAGEVWAILARRGDA